MLHVSLLHIPNEQRAWKVQFSNQCKHLGQQKAERSWKGKIRRVRKFGDCVGRALKARRKIRFNDDKRKRFKDRFGEVRDV